MPTNGNRTDRAISFAAERLKAANFPSGNIVILATDASINALNAAQNAAAEGYKVSAIEISNNRNNVLQKIARVGGGIYLNYQENPQKLAEFIQKNHTENMEISNNKTEVWQDYGYYLLIFPLLCCLYLFRRGILFAFLLMFFRDSLKSSV